MNWGTLSGLLQQYSGQNPNPSNAADHFDQVASAVSPPALGGALADMFRSSDTPPFAQLAAQLFGNANGAQKASVLNELLSSAGPALPSILGSSGLGALVSQVAAGGAVTPEAAEQVPPEVVQQMAQHVEQQDPSIVDRLGALYAQHPALVKTLGSALLAVALAKVGNRTQG